MSEEFDAKAAREGNARDWLARHNIDHLGLKVEVNVQWRDKDGTDFDDHRRAMAVKHAIDLVYARFARQFGVALVTELATQYPELCRGKDVIVDRARPS